MLQELQGINRCLDCSLSAVSLGNLEDLVLRRLRLLIQDVRDGLRLEIQQLRHVAQRCRCLQSGKSGHASRDKSDSPALLRDSQSAISIRIVAHDASTAYSLTFVSNATKHGTKSAGESQEFYHSPRLCLAGRPVTTPDN